MERDPIKPANNRWKADVLVVLILMAIVFLAAAISSSCSPDKAPPADGHAQPVR